LDQISDLIGRIYESATGAPRAVGLSELMRQAAAAEAAWLVVEDQRTRLLDVADAAGDAAQPPWEIIAASFQQPELSLDSRPVANGGGDRQAATLMVHRGAHRSAVLALARRVPFLPADLERLSVLGPHLRRALGIEEQMSLLRRRSDDAAEAFDSVPLAMMVVDADQRPMSVNRAARDMLADGDGLYIEGGRVEARMQEIATAFTAAVRGATAGEAGRRVGGGLVVPRAGGRRPLTMFMAPMRAADGPGCALIVAKDPERTATIPSDLLARLYGLTVAETRVAVALAQGKSPAEISADLRIKADTVRTNLKRVFAKTDTNRQAELVQLLLSTMPMLVPDGAVGSDPNRR
jgi:DNA-binding CsgD family transcriptional regulator